jgi:hypothetical protein
MGAIRHEHRTLVGDIKPYELPESLDELHGPDHGSVSLRHSVRWAPGDGSVSLDTLGGIRIAYRAVIEEGRVEDQVAVLNAARLVQVWNELTLARRARQLWEDRFPELCSAPAA